GGGRGGGGGGGGGGVGGLVVGGRTVGVTTAAGPVAALVGRAPEIGAAIKEKLYVLDWPLSALRELQNAIAPGDPNVVKVERGWAELFAPEVGFVTPAASQL